MNVSYAIFLIHICICRLLLKDFVSMYIPKDSFLMYCFVSCAFEDLFYGFLYIIIAGFRQCLEYYIHMHISSVHSNYFIISTRINLFLLSLLHFHLFLLIIFFLSSCTLLYILRIFTILTLTMFSAA